MNGLRVALVCVLLAFTASTASAAGRGVPCRAAVAVERRADNHILMLQRRAEYRIMNCRQTPAGDVVGYLLRFRLLTGGLFANFSCADTIAWRRGRLRIVAVRMEEA